MKNDREILFSCFLFSGIAPDALAGLPEPESFARAAVICDENDPRRALGILLSGSATALAPGSETVLNRFLPGAVFGAAAVFSPDGYVSRIVAKTECRVVFLDEPFLRALFRKHPQAAENYIGFLAGRIRFLNGKLAVYTASGAASRVLAYLQKSGGATENRAALARTLGIGRTTLYRVLDELQTKKMIVIRDGKIEVVE